uniref:STAS domain-containing protein n=2 Tax=Meloidogyne incognita group TaxID=654580 RepID=A0A914NGG3_MELIC
MDSSNQHLLGGIRRAPMNQDEFDTKFNFSSERKTKQRRYSLDSIVENQPQAVANDLCGGALLCWRRAAQRSISIVVRPQIPPQQPQQRQKPSRQHISLASAHSGSGGVSNLPLPRYQLSNADEGDHLWSSKHCPTTHLPIIRVIQRYSFRKDLFGDFRAGLALSLHGTAEGLAMAFLAGLPPICGLYTTFYSSLVYLFFGTSNFSFMGTNLAVCFFLGNIIERNTTVEGNNIISYGSLEVASTAIILCAIVNSAIYLFRLDFLFGLFSEQIIAGFSFGLGTRIVFNQLGNIIQLKSNRICEGDQLTIKQASIAIASNSIPATTTSFPCILWAYYRRLNVPNNSKKTSFNLINQNLSSSILNSTKIIKNNIIESENNCLPSIWECFDAINLNTLAASLLCIFLIIFTRQIIGPLTRFRLRSAISSEFLLIILASLLSNILNIKTKWQLDTINFSESKLFLLSLPSRSLISQLFTDSIGLAFFVFVLHLRSANLLSKTNKYKIDERQELISINLINLLSTFVSAIPPGHSPLRTSIGTRAGAKTILANISLVLSLIPIIIWSSKLFQSLPICVLSCILLTEICPMFAGIAKLPLLWEISRLDVLSFVFSALMALFSSNLSQALFVSVILSAGTIIVRAQWPRLQQLTNVTGSGAYYAERCYYGGSDLMDEAGVSVVRFEAPILFHNSSYFKACIRESAAKIKGQLLGIGIGTRTGSMKSMKSTNAQIVSGSIHNKDSIQMRSTLLISGDFVPNIENPGGAVLESNNNNLITKVLIIDFSSVPYIDGQAIFKI